jgi:hypothetical protein
MTKDAWEQLHDLWEENSKEWKVRPDLKVFARGPDRGVELRVGTSKRKVMDQTFWNFYTTDRNVGTMRELAQALLDACDFVDAVNPEWAGLRR